jgi:hypothetical protein
MAGIDGKSRFLETLRTACESDRAVAVYSDSEDYQSYEVGFVEHVDSRELVLQCLTSKGEPDGRRVLRMDEVMRVDMDNAYTKKLELLYQYRDSVFEKSFRPGPTSKKIDVRTQLLHAQQSNTIVHLVDGNDYGPSGFVREVGEDYVEIERVGPNGEPDGRATMLMGNVAKVHIGRRSEQILEFLYKYNYELKRLLGA